MSRSDGERVDDIVEAASEIVAIVGAGREAWRSDRVRQLAVERLLEIIGESARAMTDAGRAQYPTIPWAEVIAYERSWRTTTIVSTPIRSGPSRPTTCQVCWVALGTVIGQRRVETATRSGCR